MTIVLSLIIGYLIGVYSIQFLLEFLRGFSPEFEMACLKALDLCEEAVKEVN